MHKRKHRKSLHNAVQSTASADSADASPNPCLHIQAHEADVVRGPPAAVASLLEYPAPLNTAVPPGNNSRSGLVRWGAEHSYGTDVIGPQEPKKHLLWVDRYDVRLLLDSLPDHHSETTQSRPLSPSGWSDLPSDSEDTFFFSPDELEDYRREKRRRVIDRGREERLRALAAIDGPEEDPDPWGGSDEEPNEAQRELMRRTASHITSSPNPGQLEMRILANYGTDKRFAFLRGRWSRVWKTEKERARQCQEKEEEKNQPTAALGSLGGLANYGDSETDGEDLGDKPTEEPEDATDTARALGSCGNEDETKEARRARAREWSARRRARQPPRSDESTQI